MNKMKPRDPPWLPAKYTYSEVVAIRALAEGKANEHQQVTALKWITAAAAMTYDEPFYSDPDGGERNTAYACGKAYVGKQILKLINLPGPVLDNMRKEEEKNGRRSNTEHG